MDVDDLRRELLLLREADIERAEQRFRAQEKAIEEARDVKSDLRMNISLALSLLSIFVVMALAYLHK